MDIAWLTALPTSFNDAVKRTRDALVQQGFGVLTEIDMKATLKQKLGADMEDYLILGACNPPWRTGRWTSTARSGCCCPATWSCAPILTTKAR
jgi:Domain of unknown function DUF302